MKDRSNKVTDIRHSIQVNLPPLFDSQGVSGPRPKFRSLDEAISFYEDALLSQFKIIKKLQSAETE